MARTSNTQKARYEKLDEGSNVCYFCGAPSSLEDLTPASSISDMERDMFPGKWVRVNACRKHWSQIYTANIVNAGAQFGTRKGMMTIEQKQGLIGGTVKAPEGAIVLGFDKQWLVPSGTLLMGQHFMVGGAKYDETEIRALQPALAMRYLDRPMDQVRMALHQAFAEGVLEVDEADRYESLLGLQ